MGRLVFISILILLILYEESQAQKTLIDYDKSTYDLYVSKKWDELIEEGKRSIENGFDFYYLRVRMGIAYYENENYIEAIPQFENALSFIPEDSVSAEYLYYSNIFLGRKKEALVVTENFPEKFSKKKLLSNTNFFDGLYTEGGVVINSGYDNLSKSPGKPPQKGIFEEYKQTKNYRYNNLSLVHNLSKRVSIFHGIGNIYINNTKQFSSLTDGNIEFDIKTNQWDYYLSTGLYAGAGINLYGFIHYLNVDVEDFEYYIDSGFSAVKTVYKKTRNQSDELLGGFNMSYNFSHFQISNTFSASNFNDGNQYQNTIRVIYYPMGNLNLYFINDFTGHFQKQSGETIFKNRFLWTGRAGVKLSDDFWAEAFYTNGEIENYNEENGYIVYNNYNVIRRKLGFNLIFSLSTQFELSIRYQNYEQTSYKFIYFDSTNYTTNSIKNINHSIIGGIKWTF